MARSVSHWCTILLAGSATLLVSCGEQQQSQSQSADSQTPNSPAEQQATAPASTEAESPADQLAQSEAVFPEFLSSIRLGDHTVPARTAGSVRIATYNVENLFDEVDDPALSGDVEDLDDTKPREHLDIVARSIVAGDADIIALQEIESREALQWFLDGWLADAGYDHVVSIDAGDGRGIENAIISRFPILESEVYPNMPLEGVHPPDASDRRVKPGDPLVMRRGPLRAVINVNGFGPVTFFVVHHKSGGRRTVYWRGAEAAGVGKLVREYREASGLPVVVLGDMNSTPQYETHEMYHKILGLADLVADAGNEQPTHASSRRIDMIYASPELAAHVVPGSGFALGTPIRAEGQDWRTTPDPEGWASDHFLVAADLLVPSDRVPSK